MPPALISDLICISQTPMSNKPESMTESEMPQEAPELLSPGQQLQAARERLGVSKQEMADKLHLRLSNIEALEADIQEEQLSTTFAKGYLKLYAKHLGIPEPKILEAYDKLNTKKKEPAKLQSFSQRVARQASDDRLMLVTYLVVAVVFALAVLWWWQQDWDSSAEVRDDNPTTTLSQVENPTDEGAAPKPEAPADAVGVTQTEASLAASAPIPAQPSDVDPQVQLPVDETEATALPETAAVDTDLSQAQTVADADDSLSATAAEESALLARAEAEVTEQEATDEAPLAASELAEGEVELVFQFTGDCWMKLTDATGETVAFGIKKEGATMPVSGVPPFNVILGVPEVVQITYQSQLVDMSQFPAGRTARFSLPLAE